MKSLTWKRRCGVFVVESLSWNGIVVVESLLSSLRCGVSIVESFVVESPLWNLLSWNLLSWYLAIEPCVVKSLLWNL